MQFSTLIPTLTVLGFASAAPAPATQDISYTDNIVFRDTILNAHNFYRDQHSAQRLVWGDTLRASAQSWANGCVWAHSKTPGAGENIALGYASTTDVVDAWGLERTLYDYNNPVFGHDTGHFTQVVWKGTTAVGCARTYCPNTYPGGVFVVCQYKAPGNFAGRFADNVGRQVSGNPAVGLGGPAGTRFG
ncbi:extracellular SCP domain-containing protein Pry1 [Halenospora varia]|nr:extracellular SCP domain-containing protein Pry1 [Halenospora varia]